jgi:Tol biopolymer transport system component
MASSRKILCIPAVAGIALTALAFPCFATLSRVSQGNDVSGWSHPSGKRDSSTDTISVSSDGTYVAFVTDARNMRVDVQDVGDTVAVLRNVQTGVNTLVSPSNDGQSLDGAVDEVCVSADGHYVVFDSSASNMVSGDTNDAQDVFVRDTWLNTTTRISVADGGGQANNDSWITSHCISADGRYVVFESDASNLTSATVSNGDNVFVRDLQAQRTYLISKSTAGVPADAPSEEATISSTGRYITYFSMADNLVSGVTGNSPRVYIRDTNSTANTTTLVAAGYLGAVSSDGRYVTYTTAPGTASPWAQVYVHDMTAGTDKALSVATDGVTLGNRDSLFSWISDNGRYVTFTSKASTLVSGDTNGESDVFLRDLQTNTTTRISVAMDGAQGNRASGGGVISGDGRYIAFVSACEDFVPMDMNEAPDVFLAGPLFTTTSFKVSDAVTAAAIAGGQKASTSTDVNSYNVVKTGTGASRVDLADAVRIARIAAGLDPQ